MPNEANDQPSTLSGARVTQDMPLGHSNTSAEILWHFATRMVDAGSNHIQTKSDEATELDKHGFHDADMRTETSHPELSSTDNQLPTKFATISHPFLGHFVQILALTRP